MCSRIRHQWQHHRCCEDHHFAFTTELCSKSSINPSSCPTISQCIATGTRLTFLCATFLFLTTNYPPTCLSDDRSRYHRRSGDWRPCLRRPVRGRNDANVRLLHPLSQGPKKVEISGASRYTPMYHLIITLIFCSRARFLSYGDSHVALSLCII